MNSIFMKKVASAVTAFAMVVAVAAPFTALAAAPSDLQITCDTVTRSGNTWTFTGTWHAYDYPGQSTQYDAAVFSPTGTLSDASSKDVPDTYVITQGPSINFTGAANKDDMRGTWSNQVVFANTPTSVSAALYHGQTAGGEISPDSSCSFDVSSPTVTINQAVAQADPTSVSPINFTAIFNETVTGFATGDVTLSGTAGATTAVVTGSGTTYNVAVSGMTTNGTVIATVGASVAVDGAGNGNAGSISTDNTVTYNAFDLIAPTVTINQGSTQSDPTTLSPILFDVLFSEIVSGFIGADVSFTGSTAGGVLSAFVSGSGTTYTVSVTGMTSTGTVVASIPAGAAQDGSSNLSGASTSDDNSVTFQVDLCSNIDGVQTTVSAGYESLSEGQCTVIPQCRDSVDNGDAEDSLVDANDPGCWTDPNNSGTYNSNDTDETDPADVCPNDTGIQTSSEQCTPDACTNIEEFQATVPAGYETLSAGICTVIPQCRDDVDNGDAEDSLVDANDPGCWTNPNDSETYNGDDTDETDPVDVCANDAGIQTSEGQCTPDACTNIEEFQATVPAGYETLSAGICTVIPQCRDDVDNSDEEDSLSDENDPGCWIDPNNSETYNGDDTNESDAADVCPNDQGVQTSEGQCTPDACTNIPEFQGSVLEGYESLEAGQCTLIPQCRDGIDNDEDGTTDFGEAGDLGCASPDDPNESDDPLICGVGSHIETTQPESVAPTCSEGYEYNSETNSCEAIVILESFFFAPSVPEEEGSGEEEVLGDSTEETPAPEEETPVVEEEVTTPEEPVIEEETPVETPEEQLFSFVLLDEPTPFCPEGLALNGETDMCEGESYEICVADEPVDMCPDNAGVQTSSDECTSGGGGGGGGGRRSNNDGEVLGAETGPTCELLLTTYMRLGAANDSAEVTDLQGFLNEHMGSGLPLTGFFGQMTDAAVRAFQLKYWEEVLKPWFGIPDSAIKDQDDATGYVFKTTQRMINNLFCPSLNLPMPELP